MELNIRILADLLPHADITKVTDGMQAVEACKSKYFDLIIMDLQMPNLDGIEATRQIRELAEYVKTPIIGLTAGNALTEKEKCLQAGMSDFVAKPIRMVDLENSIAQFFSLHPIKKEEREKVTDTHIILDMTILQQHYGNDQEFKDYFLNLLLDELKEVKNKLQFQILDKVSLEALLHKLKGTASTVGLNILTFIVAEVEQKIINDMDFTLGVQTIKEEIEKAINLISKVINEK